MTLDRISRNITWSHRWPRLKGKWNVYSFYVMTSGDGYGSEAFKPPFRLNWHLCCHFFISQRALSRTCMSRSSRGSEMKYRHVCLAAHGRELELHLDGLNDIAARKWAVSRSDIMTCERTQLSWTLSHARWNPTLCHQLPSDSLALIGHGLSDGLLQGRSWKSDKVQFLQKNEGSGARWWFEFSTFTLSYQLKT